MSTQDGSKEGGSETALPEHLMEQYKSYVDLFKFYVDVALRATIWFYAITGAILTYYFDKGTGQNSALKFSLLLPAALSIGFALIFLRGRAQLQELKDRFAALTRALGLEGAPHVSFLQAFMVLGALLFAAVAASLLALVFLDLSAVLGRA